MARSTRDGDLPDDRSRGRREQVLDELRAVGRRHSNATVMFHTTVAGQLGLNATESKTLDLLERVGPMSPGRLAQLTGLAPASVTGVLDRLQGRGLIRRMRDPEDGRRQLIEMDRSLAELMEPLFADFIAELDRLYAGYSTGELELILDWLTRATDIQLAAAQRLSAASTAGAGERADSGR